MNGTKYRCLWMKTFLFGINTKNVSLSHWPQFSSSMPAGIKPFYEADKSQYPFEGHQVSAPDE
jgi:hypothetical protein